MPFTEQDPKSKDGKPKLKMPEVSGGAAATAPVDQWREPRTITSLSFIDGWVGRGYITMKVGTITEEVRQNLNESLSKYLFIENPQTSSHIWNEQSLIWYLAFLAEEVRGRRAMLGLTAADKALIIMDQASAHQSTAYLRISEAMVRAAQHCNLTAGVQFGFGMLET